MKIIKNCWAEVFPFECQFGAHVFDGENAKIYVNHWLTVSQNLTPFFYRKNQEGFVGHCLLTFVGVRKMEINVVTHHLHDGGIVFHNPVSTVYHGDTSLLEVNSFLCEGSIQGFSSSVSIAIEAREFELHILEKDEPAKEG